MESNKLKISLLFIFILLIPSSLAITNFTNSSTLYYPFDSIGQTDLLGRLNFTKSGYEVFTGVESTSVLKKSLFIVNGSYLTLSQTPLPNNGSFSISLWVNLPNTTKTDQYIFSSGSTAGNAGVYIAVNSLGKVRFALSGINNIDSVESIPSNVWTHIVITHNGSNTNMYINGTLRLVNTTFSYNIADTANNYIGRYLNPSSPGTFDGYVDEFGIWNRTLSSQEINATYLRGVGGNPFIPSSLSSPAYSVFTTNSSINFTGGFIANANFSIANASLYIWNTGGIFNFSRVNLGGDYNFSTTQVNNIPDGIYQWNYYVCQNGSGSGITNCTFSPENNTFVKGIGVQSVIFNNMTLGAAGEEFILNLNISSTISSSLATLVYNNTRYSSTKSTSGGITTFSNDIVIPAVESRINKYFYWELILDNVLFNSSTYVQTVDPILFGQCNATLATQVLNFTTYDSATSSKINATFEATFELYPFTGSTEFQEFNFEDLSQNNSNWRFCVNSSTAISTNAFISYSATGYDRREYILSNASLGSSSSNIPLFLAATADTDVVTVTIKDENYNALVGALVSIQEWDVGTNTFNTIGMFYTDNQGQGIINLELFNVWYRASIVYQGSIVEVTEPQKLADVTWDITVDLPSENPYEIFNSITYGLTFNNATNITEFSWVDTSGFVQQGCLRIRQSTSLGYQTISLECTTSVASTISYLLNETGEYEITGTIYLVPTYNVSQIVDTLFVRLGTPELQETVSPFGKVITFIFTGTSAYIGVSAANPIWGALLLLLSIAISWKLGWMNITENIFWGIVILIIIILLRQSKK